VTLRQRLRFLHWFATRDLFEENARRTTFVNCGSIALVTALTLAAFGLALGVRALRLKKLAENPLALCLWIGETTTSPRINPEALRDLDTTLRKALGTGFVGCYPFFVQDQNWVPLQSDAAVPIGLRTIAPGDPLLSSLMGPGHPPHHGGPFTQPNQDGVIVTETMLDKLIPQPRPAEATRGPRLSAETVSPALHRARDAYPSELKLRLVGADKPVPLVGVIDGVMPYGLEVLMTQDYEDRIRTEDSNGQVRVVYTGPAPESWPFLRLEPDLDKLPKNLLTSLTSDTFGIHSVRTEYPVEDQPPVWRLETSLEGGLLRSSWKVALEAIRDAMTAEGKAPPPEFVSLMRPDPHETVRPPERKAFDMAGVYVADLGHLEPAGEVLAARKFYVPWDVIEQLKGIDSASSRALLATLVTAFVFLANGCANMRVIQKLRAEQKQTEMGMLKAMGMDDGLMRETCLYEAAVVWAAGSVVGLALGLVVGLGLSAAFLAERLNDVLVGFPCPWWLWLGVPAVTGLTFFWSSISGTRAARCASPIETLKAN
jgi:hypothetical protein